MASHTGGGAGAHERIENDGAGRRVNLRSATQLVRQLTVRLHHFKIESIFKFVKGSGYTCEDFSSVLYHTPALPSLYPHCECQMQIAPVCGCLKRTPPSD